MRRLQCGMYIDTVSSTVLVVAYAIQPAVGYAAQPAIDGQFIHLQIIFWKWLASPCASSIKRMPKDQMSARSSYPVSGFGATTCGIHRLHVALGALNDRVVALLAHMGWVISDAACCRHGSSVLWCTSGAIHAGVPVKVETTAACLRRTRSRSGPPVKLLPVTCSTGATTP
jgi:hypothetical protein